MIRVQKLQKMFGQTQALRQVSLLARDGQITGLLGENGAGKTTTIRAIAGILKPDAGQIEIDGQKITFGALPSNGSLGVLADAKGLYERLTSIENIVFFARLNGLDEATIGERLGPIIDLLDMQDIANRKTLGFSTGQRVKVALARVLIANPQNLVLDEPTAGLDVMSTRNLRDILRRLRDEGRCVMLSSHIMQEVEALCESVVIVHEGASIAEGAVDILKAQAGQSTMEDTFVHFITGQAS